MLMSGASACDHSSMTCWSTSSTFVRPEGGTEAEAPSRLGGPRIVVVFFKLAVNKHLLDPEY